MVENELRQLVEDLLKEVRELRGGTGLPSVLTKQRAARELSISLSKLKGLIRAGDIAVCDVGKTTMVPASEVLRLAKAMRRVAPQRARPVKRTRQQGLNPAEEAAKVRGALKKKPTR
jgi:hypothetical protein